LHKIKSFYLKTDAIAQREDVTKAGQSMDYHKTPSSPAENGMVIEMKLQRRTITKAYVGNFLGPARILSGRLWSDTTKYATI
jgi:hypothetical protein